jgi:hypothetical protein
VRYTDLNGEIQNEWDERMGTEWQITQRRRMGPAAYAASYMNEPLSEEARLLHMHEELNTYTVEKPDEAFTTSPLQSQAKVSSHVLAGWDNTPGCETLPIAKPLPARVWGDIVRGMRRFITVDWAETASPDSDYSAIHVMGVENSLDYHDTLWSLDLWQGKVSQEELVNRTYRMALKWHVPIVGVEAYPVRMEFVHRLRHDLPGMYGAGTKPPAILEIKFPSSYSKITKIAGIGWRFTQFRIKLPIDRCHSAAVEDQGYRALLEQIMTVTEVEGTLRHDDAIDTLAMSSAPGLGSVSVPTGPEKQHFFGRMEQLRRGETMTDEGIPLLSGMNASEIPEEVLWEMIHSDSDSILAGEDPNDDVVEWWQTLPGLNTGTRLNSTLDPSLE